MDQTLQYLFVVLSVVYLVSFVALIYNAFSASKSPAARAVIIACVLPVIGLPLAAWYSSKHPRGENG